MSAAPSVEVRASVWRGLGLLAIFLAFTAVGLFLVGQGGIGAVIGWVCIAFFGVLGIPAGLYLTLWRPLLVRLRPDGIDIHRGPTVAWADVHDVGLATVTGGTRLAVVETTPEVTARMHAEAGGVMGRTHRANAALLGEGRLPLPTGASGGPQGLADTVNSYRARHVREREAGER